MESEYTQLQHDFEKLQTESAHFKTHAENLQQEKQQIETALTNLHAEMKGFYVMKIGLFY